MAVCRSRAEIIPGHECVDGGRVASAICRKLGPTEYTRIFPRTGTHLQDVAEDGDVLRMQDLLREHSGQLAPDGIRNKLDLCL